MVLSKTHLLQLESDKLLNIQKHDRYPLWILNYSKEAQYQNFPDPLLEQTRGMVVEDNGSELMKIIATPFNKIRNIEELPDDKIPVEEFDVYDKLDGSLGIIFRYEGEIIIATRGSFNSDQAVRAKGMLSRYDLRHMHDEATLLVEIIYPENRIVVDYEGREELVMLTMFNKDLEVLRPQLEYAAAKFEMPLVGKISNYLPLKSIKGGIADNQEGYVIRFKSGLRVKIKGEEYCRLHRIVTGVSNYTIWEHLRQNKPITDIIDRVPDEWFKWVDETVKGLKMRYKAIFDDMLWDTVEVLSKLDRTTYTKKDYALNTLSKKYPGLMFSIEKGLILNVDQGIWKIIENELEFEKPFNNAKVTSISGD